MDYLDEICDMLGVDESVFISEAVSRALRIYLNSDGEFKPRRGKYINDGSECVVLDDIKMFGRPYYKVYYKGDIRQAPVDSVVLV